MYKGIIDTPIAIGANIDIPFRTELNTNIKTSANNGVVSIRDPGYWNAKAQINFTGVNGDIVAQFYNNGEPIPDTSWSISAANTEVLTATLLDVLKVVRSYGIDFAKISIRFNLAATINRAVFIVDEVK